MNTTRTTILVLLTLAGTAFGQAARSPIYSRPRVPSAETLRRLDLNLAWSGAVPMDGRHDAIAEVLLDGKDLLVLTRSGQVARLDAERGDLIWKARPARAYTAAPYLAANTRTVYVIANATMYALDRERGFLHWEYPLPAGLSAGPVVDDEQIYVPRSDGRLSSYVLPFLSVEADGTRGTSPVYGKLGGGAGERLRPTARWSEDTGLELAYRPLQTADALFVLSPSGRGRGYSKTPKVGQPVVNYLRFQSEGKVRAPAGQFGNMAFIGADDAMVYALDLNTGRLVWRHTAGTGITRRPVALESDVFVTSDREGMARLDRSTGDPLWRVPVGRGLLGSNSQADRFLAASERFVYAMGDAQKLLVLDRKRGVTRAALDVTDFRVPVVNEITDRLYLAANDGTIVCLHDREQVQPLRHRKKLEDAAASILRDLDRSVDEKPSGPAPLNDLLVRLREKYGVRFVFATKELTEAGLTELEKKEAAWRLIEDKPLREVYKQLLKPLNAGFRVEDNTLLIVPEAKAEKDPAKEPKEPKKDPKEPKDDKDPKDDKKDDKKEKKDDKKEKKDDDKKKDDD